MTKPFVMSLGNITTGAILKGSKQEWSITQLQEICVDTQWQLCAWSCKSSIYMHETTCCNMLYL